MSFDNLTISLRIYKQEHQQQDNTLKYIKNNVESYDNQWKKNSQHV